MLDVTPRERLALGVTALLLTAGSGVRILTPDPAPVEWQQLGGDGADTPVGEGLAPLRAEAGAALGRERVAATPLRDGERIDPNRATADELDRLPRVGPALAARMVEWREEQGGFRTLADVDSVPGVGPALLAALTPLLDLDDVPASARNAPGREPLDLNRATAGELDALPGIGPVLAERIVAWRDSAGGFRSLEELESVPGIGPSLRARMAAEVRVGP